ncbi:MAG TPA: ribosome-binding factor A, partial [Phycisphaerae bacterium]|nr:ribosome-binding factor A [Phycisphaerae bacterium]
NAPDVTFIGYTQLIRAHRGETLARSLFTVGSGTHPLALTRVSNDAVVVHAPGGFYQRDTELLTRDLYTPMPAGTRVEVPDDLLTAKVYVSVIGTEAEQRTTLRALRHAAGRVQELMMREIRLRHTPLLEFALDEKFKKTLETYRLIQVAMDEIRQKEQRQSGEPAEAEGQNGQEPGNQDSQR